MLLKRAITRFGMLLRIQVLKDLAETTETTPWLVPVDDPWPTAALVRSRNLDEAFYFLLWIYLCTPQSRSLPGSQTRQRILGHLGSPARVLCHGFSKPSKRHPIHGILRKGAI